MHMLHILTHGMTASSMDDSCASSVAYRCSSHPNVLPTLLCAHTGNKLKLQVMYVHCKAIPVALNCEIKK